jgi:hypothetical protein
LLHFLEFCGGVIFSFRLYFLLDIEVLDIDSWVLVLVEIDGCALKEFGICW